MVGAGNADREVVAAQVGRPLRSEVVVLRRCAFGLPVSVAVPPVLETGEPFPTRYWLTCVLACKRIARIEAAGGVQRAQQRLDKDPEFRHAWERNNARYAEARDRHIPPSAPRRPRGGVGGARHGIKCLHAHYADFLARGENPVGASIDAAVGALDCATPCVAADPSGRPARCAEWREP